LENKDDESYLPFKNLKKEEHMFHANNIYSSYYWFEKDNEPVGLVIDVAFADHVVEAFNEKLS